MSAYVITKWNVNPNGDATTGNYIEIEGRAAGLLAWIMTKVGLSPTVSMHVKADKVVYSASSLHGSETRNIPLTSVSSSYYGYKKPWLEALLIGFALLFVFGIGIIVGPLYYFLSKAMTVGFIEVSGVGNAVSFKRSVIEGIKVEDYQAKEVADIIERLSAAARR